MVEISHELVEKEIINVIKEINNQINIKEVVDADFCPGTFIPSQVLLTQIGRIGKMLNVVIPDNCYIFHDKTTSRQLSVKEAVQKLIKEAKYGN